MRRHCSSWLPLILLASLGVWLGLGLARAADEPLPAIVEFNRDIRPILSDACFHCHGPDSAKRKAQLRLDTEEDALADRGGYQAIMPGKPAHSEIYRRIVSSDERERMPPSKLGRPLTERQIRLLARWIEQGARWQKHWAFIPPQRPIVPQPPHPGHGPWVRNPIDAFVLERLTRAGWQPSPEADRAILVRRVTLDLTGLPPTPAEVEAALHDPAPDWYDKVVDRLLASPRYGERMALRWLDAARYADTNGYQDDGERHMWRWRDWVIDAFNRNLPFDQFTIEQLAGDLLPHATLEQRIATGFNRNHRINAEGGIIPEEYAVEYVADRVETTATVWLGLTLTCARCHDHKYDPIKQREFYQLFAYFNNVPEHGRGIKYGNSPPYIQAPTRDQQAQLQTLQRQLAQAEERLRRLEPEITAAQTAWEKHLLPIGPASAEHPQGEPIAWTVTDHLIAHFPLDAPTAGVRFQDGPAAFVPGRLGQAAELDGRRFLQVDAVGKFGFHDRFSLAAWIYPRGSAGGTILARMADTARAKGYSLALVDGKLQFNLVVRWLDDALRVQTQTPLLPERWYHVLATYDGSKTASSVRLYVNGQEQQLDILLDALNQDFQENEPLRIGAGQGSRFHGLIDDVRLYADSLTPDDAALVACAESITDLLTTPEAQRTPAQALKLRRWFLEEHAPPTIQHAYRHLRTLARQRSQLMESLPTTMVMAELPTPRPTFVLIRGEYDKPGERVQPGIPAVLRSSPKPNAPETGNGGGSVGSNRLDLARWLVDRRNPLTARVAVNRFWQMYFGVGLVKTAEDFGSQGEWPSHPELLDWLAVAFMDSGWDVKALQRLIVTSATYRQASRITPVLLEKDPENRLLARGPRVRLPAEMIRDQALAASGLLVERLGGPSVKPYQPPGLWKELSGGKDYVQDHGANLYRRSLYTFWKRTVTPPAMLTFDASMRETCVVRETRTNTPLQALNLMNDVTYVEAARVLAQRLLTNRGPSPQERITHAFRLLLARPPKPVELQVLLANFHHQRQTYRQDPTAARKLASAGEYPRDETLDVAELAAYTAVVGLIMNLDETITKE